MEQVVVRFYDHVEDELLKFVVIIAKYNGKWVFCRHKDRKTYECPGGHIEKGETSGEAAERELREETGALQFDLTPMCVYSVTGKNSVNQKGDECFGMLFVADIRTFQEDLHCEIEEIILTKELIDNWTYPQIQPKLIAEAQRRGCV